MKYLGCEIGEDGITQWRNNGGIIERRALYVSNQWESVGGVGSQFDLKKYCHQRYKYTKTLKEAKKIKLY